MSTDTNPQLRSSVDSGARGPLVTSCRAAECAYNHDGECRAGTVSIGDDRGPYCDTFRSGDAQSAHDPPSRVTACRMTQCVHWDGERCAAGGIEIGYEWGVECLTFEAA